MPSLLVKNAALLVTMDDADLRWEGGGLYVEDNVVRKVGPTTALPHAADRLVAVRDLAGRPGAVDCPP